MILFLILFQYVSIEIIYFTNFTNIILVHIMLLYSSCLKYLITLVILQSVCYKEERYRMSGTDAIEVTFSMGCRPIDKCSKGSFGKDYEVRLDGDEFRTKCGYFDIEQPPQPPTPPIARCVKPG